MMDLFTFEEKKIILEKCGYIIRKTSIKRPPLFNFGQEENDIECDGVFYLPHMEFGKPDFCFGEQEWVNNAFRLICKSAIKHLLIS